MVDGLLRAREAQPDYPDVLFVHRDSEERGAAYFAKHAADVSWVADPDGELFAGFGVIRARWAQMLGWTNLKLGWRAWRAGYGVGKPSRDVTRMPGLVLVDSGRVVWEHEFSSVGDHPDFAAIG